MITPSSGLYYLKQLKGLNPGSIAFVHNCRENIREIRISILTVVAKIGLHGVCVEASNSDHLRPTTGSRWSLPAGIDILFDRREFLIR